MKTVYPKPDSKLLRNPGRGYVMSSFHDNGVPAEYASVAQYYDMSVASTSAISLKLTWKAIQPKCREEYNWSVIDQAIERAEKYDMKVMLGLNMIVATGGVQDGIKSLVPDWVYELGAKYNDIDCPNFLLDCSDINRIPEWEDPLYRQLNEEFIAAVAARYDGHPRVDCVINFSHGNWGEWHHLDINYRPEGGKENLYIDFRGRKLDLEYFKYYVDLFPKYFKKTPCVMPINTFDKEDELEPWAKYAVDTYNYGFKREGLGTIPDCTWGMKYCRGKGPSFVEWQTCYIHFVADGRWSDALLDKQIIDGHVTHFILDYGSPEGWCYLQEKPELVHYWANHMGYYYSVKCCTYDDGKAAVTICNDGVAPTYLHPVCELAMVKDGKVIKTWQSDEIQLNTIDEKTEKTFTVALPKGEEGAVLGIRFLLGDDELYLANVQDETGYYLMQDDGDVHVHFDHRPRQNGRITGKYMGIDFGKQAWCTNLRHEKYVTCLYPDIYLKKYDMMLTLPEGKKLKSFKAFGYGKLSFVDEQGHTVTAELSQDIQAFDTGFTVPSGKVTVRYDSPYTCWSVQITELVYGD